jgi:hypothetical protein
LLQSRPAVYAVAGVPMVSPSSTSPGVTQQGYSTIFRTVSADDVTPRLLARYFNTWLGLTRAPIADRPNTGYSPFLAQTFSDAFSSFWGTVVATHLITSTADYTEALTAIKLEDRQAIYCGETNPVNTAMFSKIVASLGMTDVVIAWTMMTENRSWFDPYTTTAGVAAQNDCEGMPYHNPDHLPVEMLSSQAIKRQAFRSLSASETLSRWRFFMQILSRYWISLPIDPLYAILANGKVLCTHITQQQWFLYQDDFQCIPGGKNATDCIKMPIRLNNRLAIISFLKLKLYCITRILRSST